MLILLILHCTIIVSCIFYKNMCALIAAIVLFLMCLNVSSYLIAERVSLSVILNSSHCWCSWAGKQGFSIEAISTAIGDKIFVLNPIKCAQFLLVIVWHKLDSKLLYKLIVFYHPQNPTYQHFTTIISTTSNQGHWVSLFFILIHAS